MSQFRVVLVNAVEFEKWLRKLGEKKVETVSDNYLNEQCKVMVQEMQDQLGEYQPSRGDFDSWAPLKPETIARKETGDSPLLETEEMKSECQYFSIGPYKKLIGCTNWKAAFHEYGVPMANLPARPFIRPVVWMHIDDLKMGIRKALVAALRFRTGIEGALAS